MYQQTDLKTNGKAKPKPGQNDLLLQAAQLSFDSVLDIGAGTGWASEIFLEYDKRCAATFLSGDIRNPNFEDLGYLPAEAMPDVADGQFDAVWCTHVLEHCHNTGNVLNEFHRVLSDEGWLFLLVPPFKHRLAGGHVNIGWNLGVMAYVLAIHGFNSASGSFVRHGYNLAAFVQKGEVPDIELHYDTHDIEKLKPWLPDHPSMRVNCNTNVKAINWQWKIDPKHRETLRLRLKRRLKAFVDA